MTDFESYDERDDAWVRFKEYGETWPRYSAEVPPELDVALREAQRKSLGVNYDGYQKRPTTATRANLVRAGLRLYLRLKDPMPEPVQFDIDGTCYEVRVVGELPPAD